MFYVLWSLRVGRVGEKGSLSYFRSKSPDSLNTSVKNSNMPSLLVRQQCLFFFFAHFLELISFSVTFTDLETYRDVASWSLHAVGTMTKTLIFCFSVNFSEQA